MNLKVASKLVLDHLIVMMNQIKTEDYILNISSLNASVGQHIRHILEFYICLFQGLETGIVNYDNRKRDPRIENDLQFTKDLIGRLKEKINSIEENCDLQLQIKYGDASEMDIQLNSNFFRELAYNVEHTIHHLAIIKHFIIEDFDYIVLPDHFGIASSTVRYTNQKDN